MKKKPMFERSPDTQALVDWIRLQKPEPGKHFTYPEMTEVIGRDIQANRHILNSARRILEHEDDIVFGPLRGIGIIVLEDDEFSKLGSDQRRKIGRIGRRTFSKMNHVKNYAALSQDGRNSLDAERSFHAMVAEASLDRKMKKLLPRLSKMSLGNSGRVLPVAQTLEALKGD